MVGIETSLEADILGFPYENPERGRSSSKLVRHPYVGHVGYAVLG